MTLESLIVPAIAAVLGWLLRHYGYGPVSQVPPQSRLAGGGTVSPPPAQASLEPLIRTLASNEVEKGIAALENRLSPARAADPTR